MRLLLNNATGKTGAETGEPAASELAQPLRLTKPLRIHLSVIIVLLLVGVSVPLIWLSYEQGTRSALKAATQHMGLLSRHTIEHYRSLFAGGHSVISMASVSPALVTEPPDDVEAKTAFLLKALTASRGIDGIYVGYPSGAFISAANVAGNPGWKAAISAPEGTDVAVRVIVNPEAGDRRSTWRFLDADGHLISERSTEDVSYDPRNRPWYKSAIKAADVVSVGPYLSATTKSMTLTLATPMPAAPGNIIGADVLLKTLSGLLAEEPVSKRSSAYVFDSQKRLVVHSDKAEMDRILDQFSTKPAEATESEDLVDPVLDATRDLIGPQGERRDSIVHFMVGNEPYLADISPVDFSDLVEGNAIAIVAPLADLTAESDRLLRKALLVSAILLSAGILAALLVARLISNSLSLLTVQARQIGSLQQLSAPPISSRIAEIITLAEALASARETIGTFALYVPRELVRRIVQSGQAVAGSAVRENVTILFTDIRDFTTISERHSPEEVVGMLSTYFQLMNDIVERNNGVIVQYLGDSIYAMWNAPTSDAEHVADGCRCALALKAAIDEMNADNRAAGRPELITRFGLHTGPAVVGNIGARSRLQYTAMGDTVNVASRLEGMNKQFGTTILASGAVRDQAPSDFTFRPLGASQAKGRVEAIQIYELTGID